MRHLDDANWKALQRGDAEAEAYFSAHLESGCEVCEAFLMNTADPALDGATDALLMSAGPAPKAHPADALAARRLSRSLAPRLRRWGPVVGALAAALVAVVVGPWLLRNSGDEDGLKAARPTLELQLSVVEERGEALRPLGPGAKVSQASVLHLRYQASAAGRGLVVIERANGSREVLARVDLSPGLHDLTVNGERSALSVSDEEGPITLWIVGRTDDGALDPSLASAEGSAPSPVGRAGVPLQVVED